ncbi:hypothetical protein [Methanolobus psychrotolerans]|uniref:hypothetical protein n=1 Tax=Methanolobus psychrotolerans TaxID=1874706 RepID=UPI000B91A9D7|nr:hypothetical protein [Methanolobus psychrotolerans]
MPASTTIDPSILEIGRVIVIGAVFGETGIEGGSLSYLVDYEIASSPYYLVGWIGFSLVPVVGAVADARDAVQALINGDELGAALNAAGAFSGVGDGVKTAAAVGMFTTKYSSKANDIQKVMVPLLKYVPLNQAKKIILDVLYSGAATRLVGKYGDEILPDLITIADKNGNLAKTIDVMKSNTERVVWLEEGLTKAEAEALDKTPVGWKHIFEKHIKDYDDVSLNQFANAFDPSGTNYRSAETVQSLINEGISNGKFDVKEGIYYYDVAASSEKVLKIVVGNNGFIVSAFPYLRTKVPIAL